MNGRATNHGDASAEANEDETCTKLCLVWKKCPGKAELASNCQRAAFPYAE